MSKQKHAKVKCEACGYEDHILTTHITKTHSIDPVEYLDKYPGAPLWSTYGYSFIRMHAKPGSKAAMVPRPRRKVQLEKVMPGLGKESKQVYTTDIEIFDTPGELTPKGNPNYVFPEEQTLDLLTILEKPQRNRPFIQGWSGTGKTELLFNVAHRLNAEVMEWNADSFLQRSSLIGHWSVKNGETVFVYGILPQAMMRGVWLIINELDQMDPHTVNILKPVLEDPPRLTILENGNEVIHAHPDFRAIATANTWGRGDSSGQFPNAMVQSDADMRRWSARIKLDYLSPKTEIRLLRRYFGDNLEKEEPGMFVQVANKIRESYIKGTIDKPFSAGELINWVENFLAFGKGPHHAARISFLNSCPGDVQIAINEMLTAVFGEETGLTSGNDDESYKENDGPSDEDDED